jgi:hypothetical protein
MVESHYTIKWRKILDYSSRACPPLDSSFDHKIIAEFLDKIQSLCMVFKINDHIVIPYSRVEYKQLIPKIHTEEQDIENMSLEFINLLYEDASNYFNKLGFRV